MNIIKTCQKCGTTWEGQETPEWCPKEGCTGMTIPDTPRTNTLVAELDGSDSTLVLFAIRKCINLCRQLERELAIAQARAATLNSLCADTAASIYTRQRATGQESKP
jgi:hypothetical protein